MGLYKLFADELVIVDLKCNTAEEALTRITNLLYELGYVKVEYIQSVIEREEEYPTGLPTLPFPVALAHGDPKFVIRSAIALGILKSPVPIYEMGTPSKVLNVKIILVLAVRETAKQTDVLKGLVDILNDETAIGRLITAKSSKDVVKILQDSKVD